MKAILAITACLILGPFAEAQEIEPAPAPGKECPLCKVPNRAALLAGTTRECPADCAKLCCTGTEANYLVEGLVCINCSSKVTAALAKLDGVHVEAVCHNTGQALVKYEPAKVKPAALIAAITTAGHPVTGEKVSFPITGMTDEAGAAIVENALVRTVGVSRIETTIGERGHAVVTFDPNKTSRARIAAAINATRYKVAKEG